MTPKSKRFEDKKNKLHRLLALLRKLDNRERVTPDTLAAEFEVSRRTVLRDVRDLNESGFAVMFDSEQGCYRFVDPDYTLRDLDLNDNELMILFLGRQMAHSLGKPFEDASISLIKKATKDTGVKTRNSAEKISKESQFWMGMEYGEDFELIAAQHSAVRTAIDRKVELEITYVAMKSEEKTRRSIAPYGFIFKYGLWYVIGYCNLRGSIRIFALDCIKDFKITNKPYSIPADFKIDDYFEVGWNMYRYGEPVEVVLKFSKEYARWIKRKQWHPTQVIEEHTDGSIIFRVTVKGTRELKWWTYHWIPYCEVLSPPELRTEVMKEMEVMMKNYTS